MTPDLDRAVEQFHAALDAADDAAWHNREVDVVDGSAQGVVEALLAAGWRPPEVTE